MSAQLPGAASVRPVPVTLGCALVAERVRCKLGTVAAEPGAWLNRDASSPEDCVCGREPNGGGARKAILARGRRFLGRAEVLSHRFRKRAESFEPRRGPIPKVGARNRSLMRAMLARYSVSWAGYREALEAWRGCVREGSDGAGASGSRSRLRRSTTFRVFKQARCLAANVGRTARREGVESGSSEEGTPSSCCARARISIRSLLRKDPYVVEVLGAKASTRLRVLEMPSIRPRFSHSFSVARSTAHGCQSPGRRALSLTPERCASSMNATCGPGVDFPWRF